MRLLDVDEVYKVLTDYYHHRTEIQHEALKEALSKVSTVDAASVVRCKDCKYWDNHDGGERCLNKIAYLSWAKPNSFCSYAERKGEMEDETN